MRNRYSVYERGTDRPIMIHGTAEECARALGVARSSFYAYLVRQRKGQPQQIEIFIEEPDEEDLSL